MMRIRILAAMLMLATRTVIAQSDEDISRFDEMVESLEGPETYRTAAGWRSTLSPLQYEVLRRGKTEPAGSGQYLHSEERGLYLCAGCSNPLFESNAKYDAGVGWPSFTRPASRSAFQRRTDISPEGISAAIKCSRCDGHIGHVYSDGPAPSGLRYTVNSIALSFVEDSKQSSTRSAVFAAGCFWGAEAVFEKLKGVVSVTAGYSGGHTVNPTHERVSKGGSGHAEVVKIEYDPTKTSYKYLLATFWQMHDPTTPDRQGADVGPQYRSAIFCADAEQVRLAEKTRSLLEKAGKYRSPIVTEIWPIGQFFEAEPVHQDYSRKNHESAYCNMVINPTLSKLGLTNSTPTPAAQ